MLTKEKRKVFSEIDSFLNIIGEKYRSKIPEKLREMYKNEKDTEYNPQYTLELPLETQDMRRETISMIGLLHLNYWCENKDEKIELQRIFNNNEEKYQEEIKTKYNPDKLFKNRTEKRNVENKEISIVKNKENLYQKIKKIIEKLFHKDNL